MYEVTVGNIGCVHRGSNKKEARGVFADYKRRSRSGSGRAAGESVTLWEDTEPIDEYIGTVQDRDSTTWDC